MAPTVIIVTSVLSRICQTVMSSLRLTGCCLVMSSVIILSYWWLDSGTHCHCCNFSSLQDQDVVFCNKGKNNRTFECVGTFYQTKDNSIIVLISDINTCLQNCVKGNHLYQEYNHKWFQILSSYLPATSPPLPHPTPMLHSFCASMCVCGVGNFWLIDDWWSLI